MKNKKIIILFFVLLSYKVFCDPTSPPIYAILKIILENDSIIEGNILIGLCSNEDYYHYETANAFYWRNKCKEGIFYLSLDLEYFSQDIKDNDLYVNYYRSSYSEVIFPDCGEFYFKYLTSIPSYIKQKDTISEDLENDKIIYIKERKRGFKVSDSIEIFTSIKYLANNRNDIKKIPLNKIKSITYIKNPSNKWIEQLTNARKHWSEVDAKYIKEAGIGIERYQPIWYHELIKDEDLFKDYLIRWQD